MSEYSAISAYSRRSRLTFRVLMHLAAKGVISPALTEADRAFLERLERVWGDRTVLRAQIRRLGRADRRALLETADCETGWERYVLTRLRRAFASGRTVRLADLVAELRERFGLTPTESHLRGIRRIRNRLYVQRHRLRKAGKTGVGIVGEHPTIPEGETRGRGAERSYRCST